MMNLFIPYSRTDGVCNYNGVNFYWIVQDRQLPLLLPYEDLIENYWNLDERDKCAVEEFLHGCFTLEEVNQLRTYLLDTHRDVTFRIKPVKLPTKVLYPLDFMGEGGGDGYWRLSETKGYNLPFKVWGYYSLEEGVPSLLDENSLNFAAVLLQALKLEVPDLQAATRDIYHQAGLYAIAPQDKYKAYQIEQADILLGVIGVEVDKTGNVIFTTGDEIAEEFAALKQAEESAEQAKQERWAYFLNLRIGLTFGKLLLYELGLRVTDEELEAALKHTYETTKMIIKRWGENI